MQSPTLAVSVGYADNLRANPNFPVPWQGSPNILFLGAGPTFDAGAIRLDNLSSSPLTIDSVVVDLGRPGPTFNLWGTFTIPAQSSAILTQTAEFNFDTSDFPIVGCGQALSPNETRIPQITVTIAGVPTTFMDAGHILDTGGFDLVCEGNESLGWRPVGTTGIQNSSAHVSLSPATAIQATGTPYTAIALVTDAANQPIANVVVNFAVLSGPNAGKTGQATSDATGSAPFTYTSLAVGTDILQATVTNAAGGSIQSDQVTTTWTSSNPCSPSVTQSSNPSATTINFAGQGVGEFNDPLTLAAQLVDGNGNPLAGRSLNFTLAEQPFQATTDGNGVATVSVSAAPAPGVLALNVSFAGETNFQASQLSTTVTIGQEETAIRYTGSTLLGTGVPQQVTAVLVDGRSGTPITNEIVTFSEGSAQAQGTTKAQGVATATLTLASSPASGQAALQVSFAGDNLYKASRTSVPVTVYLPTSFVVWGGNSGGLQLGQDVNFWGHSWTNQVTGGNFTAFTANPSFKGWADPVSHVNVCEVSAGSGGPLDDSCWSSKPGNSFPPATLPPFIRVIVSTAIAMSSSTGEIFGNIASTAVCHVDPKPVYGNDPGKPGFCKLVAVLQDGANVFPRPPALIATQTQPAKVLPQQNFNVSATITNNSSTPASSVVLSESFDGVTPANGNTNIGSILNGAQQTATFQVTSPTIPLRQSSESTADYETRLANTDGRVFTSTGTITFTDSVGQQLLPVAVSSSSQLQLPELTIGISGPSCVGPGSTVPYKVTVNNQGTADARNVAILMNFPDGSNATATIASIPIAGSVTTAINFVVPPISARQPNETDQQYRARLAAIDGSSLVALAKVNWQDTLGNNYGDIQQKIVTTTERVPIIIVTPQLPLAASPGQQVTLNLSVQNLGGGNASQVLLKVTNPDGSTTSIAPFALRGGQANVVSSQFTMPVVPARQAGETDAAYQALLVARDGKPFNFQASLNWNDVAGNLYGPTSTPASTRLVVPIVTVSLTGPPVSQSGTTITYTVSGTNIGHADASSAVANITLPDGSTRQVFSGSLPLQTSFQQFVNLTVPGTRPAGTLTATATVNWQDASQDSYGPLSSSATTANTNVHTNQPPVVNAGSSQTITLPTNTVTLNGTATDDGNPSGVLLVSWSEVSGPAPVTFSNPDQAVTQATFTFTGTYVLRLTASDTQLTSASDVTVTVNGAVVGNIEVCYNCDKNFGLGQFLDGPTFVISNTSTTAMAGGRLILGPIGGSDSFSVGAIPTGGRAVVAPGLSNDGGAGHSFFAFQGGILDTSDFGPDDNDVQFRFLAQEGSFVVDSTVFTPEATQGPALDFSVANLNFLGGPNGADANCIGTFGDCFDKIVATLRLSALNVNTPFLSIAKTHTGNFNLGQQNATYALTISNAINATASSGGVTVTDILPVGLTLVSMAGTGWNCTTNSCSRPDALPPAASYPPITVTVNVASNAVTPQINKATVSGGGSATASTMDSTMINGANPAPTVSAGPNQTVTLPASSVTLNGSASGGNGPLTLTWSEVSGPAAVTFSSPNSAVTQAGFTTAGTYVLQLAATDGTNSDSATTMVVVNGSPIGSTLQLAPVTAGSNNIGTRQTVTATLKDNSGNPVSGVVVQFTVSGANATAASATTDANGNAAFTYSGANPGTDQVVATATSNGNTAISNVSQIAWITSAPVVGGWIGSPANGAVVQTPITVALQTVSLQGGTVSFFPSANPSAITVLNANASGPAGATLATFDPTTLPNGSFIIQLQGTDSNGNQQTNVVQVTVVGANKPGRVTFSATDLKIPLAGISISITRTYDSLKRDTVQDFGFGWSLSTSADLQVDASNNVSFTVNGQRSTFFFQPQPSSFLFPWLLLPTYVPQPGLHGSLVSDGCNALIQVQGLLTCFASGSYQPTTFVYTDPIGRVYTISANGQIQSLQDTNGNLLTFGANGITSSSGGISVPFVRDNQGRITQITDLNGNHYIYNYDSFGNLNSVNLPGTTSSDVYNYGPDHSLTGETDPRGNSTSMSYFPDGRLQSITDGFGNSTTYSYNVAGNVTTITFADGGLAVQTNDAFGNTVSLQDPLNRTTTFTYDANHNLTSKTDPLGNTTTYTYDANGNQTSVTDPLQHTRSKVYNQFGEITSQTDALGNVTTISYDSAFNPIKETDPLGVWLAGTVDSEGNVASITNANGQTKQFVHDANGNITKVTDPLNQITTYTYDAMNRMTSKTDPRDNTTSYGYDALGHLTSVTDANHNVTQYTYDNAGNKTAQIDALGRKTTYAYDAVNRVSQITYPDQTTRSYTYDFRGNKLTDTDQLGRVTKYVYDLAGQLTSVTYAFGTPDAATVSYTYDRAGRKATESDGRGNVKTLGYDAAGQLTTIKDALGNVTTIAHDAEGRLASITDANQHTTSFTFDARRRITSVTYPDGAIRKFTHDGMGNELSMTDRANRTTAKTYDAINRLVSVINAAGLVTQYTYDGANNLTSITDAAAHVTSFQYDNLNRQTMRKLPLGMFATNAYDAVGNMTSRTDFNGKVTTFSYDALNRLLQKLPAPSLNQPTVKFTYTATGKRASMLDASGTTTYAYDNRDRLISKATPAGTLNYTYDGAGNVLTLASSNANGVSMTYTYDADDRLSTATDNRLLAQGASSAITSYSYDPVGNLAGYTYPNGVQTNHVYDTVNHLTQMNSSKAGLLSSFIYSLGPEGNRLSASELGGRLVNYAYDAVYRLTSEAITSDPGGNNGTVGYTYDAAGNRLQINSTLGAVPSGLFSYDANDRLTTDTYDNNGNTISSAGISSSYDFEDRLIAHGAVNIVYDGDGNRAAETVAGVTTKYLVDDRNPSGHPQVVDELVNGSVTRTYAYGLSRVSQNQLVGGSRSASFYGYDGHGSVRFLTNLAGAQTDSYEFDAFGNTIATTGTTPNSFLFSGEQSDSALGLYYLRARYLNPLTGRFMTMDPLPGNIKDPGSLHRYLYAGNDPVNLIDPSGLQEVADYAAVLSAFFAYAKFPEKIGKCEFKLFIGVGNVLTDAVNGFAVPATGSKTVAYNYIKCLYEAIVPSQLDAALSLTDTLADILVERYLDDILSIGVTFLEEARDEILDSLGLGGSWPEN